MPNTSRKNIQLTRRDLELLTVLARGPHWTEHLLTVSRRFTEPFTSIRYLQKRLKLLRDAGWIRSWPGWTPTSGGTEQYHKLTRAAFVLLYGEDAKAPSKRFFDELKPMTQLHTRYLTDFLVHTDVAAWQSEVAMQNFHCDRSVTLEFDVGSLLPDASFELVTASRRHAHGLRLPFFLELDNGTERVRSSQDVESLQRKIRLYEQHRNRSLHAFRVLFVTTGGPARLNHFLQMVRDTLANVHRPVILVVQLTDYLNAKNPMTQPLFRDHFGNLVPLLGPQSNLVHNNAKLLVAPTPAVC